MIDNSLDFECIDITVNFNWVVAIIIVMCHVSLFLSLSRFRLLHVIKSLTKARAVMV